MKEHLILLEAASITGGDTATGEGSVDMEETITTGTVDYPDAGVDTFVNYALPVIGWGFLATFVVIGVLICVTTVLNKVMAHFKKKQ